MRRVEHATGEVVIVGHGNFLENPTAVMKFRPGIILVPGDCCHLVVPLTGKETFKGDGTPRRPCPAGPDTGLVQYLSDRGELPCIKMATSTRYSPADLDEFIDQCRRKGGRS